MKKDVRQLESDCLTLALRLYGEDPETFAPETAEVMDRWRPRCEAAFLEVGAGLGGAENA